MDELKAMPRYVLYPLAFNILFAFALLAHAVIYNFGPFEHDHRFQPLPLIGAAIHCSIWLVMIAVAFVGWIRSELFSLMLNRKAKLEARYTPHYPPREVSISVGYWEMEIVKTFIELEEYYGLKLEGMYPARTFGELCDTLGQLIAQAKGRDLHEVSIEVDQAFRHNLFPGSFAPKQHFSGDLERETEFSGCGWTTSYTNGCFDLRPLDFTPQIEEDVALLKRPLAD